MNKKAVNGVLLVLALVPATLAYAGALGLGLHRHGGPLVVSVAATTVVFLPAICAALATAKERLLAFSVTLLVWTTVGLMMFPVYFPGERRGAIRTGLALFSGGSDVAGALADALPDEPAVAAPELEVAEEVQPLDLPPPEPVGDHEIVLPYEGEGRNLAIPVVFENNGIEVEVMMMLDTGATYTTLSDSVLEQLGLRQSDADPVIRLHTANGTRESHILRMDHVWLGDLRIDGVAIATCNLCSSDETAGLLGLNVAGGFNVAIDADRREVTFSRRERFDRKLDIKPWIDLDASFARYPGGRVEVTVDVHNSSDQDLRAVAARVGCGDRKWVVDLGPLDAHEGDTVRRKLPMHDSCDAYEIRLHTAEF